MRRGREPGRDGQRNHAATKAPGLAYCRQTLKTLENSRNCLDVLARAEVTVGPCCGLRTWRRRSDSYPQRGDPTMAKPKSPKQPTKAAKPKKGAKPAEVQAQPPAPEPEQPQAMVTAETPPEAADPPAPDAPAAESPAPAPAQSEAAMPAEAPPEPAAPARTKGKRAPKEPKPKKT